MPERLGLKFNQPQDICGSPLAGSVRRLAEPGDEVEQIGRSPPEQRDMTAEPVGLTLAHNRPEFRRN